MASLPAFSADNFLNAPVLKLASPVVQSSPVQSSVYTLPILDGYSIAEQCTPGCINCVAYRLVYHRNQVLIAPNEE